MKIERLYAITLYLLNHGKTSASKLSEHFEVSLRTIQRDMDSLCLCGIPVISTSGATGGYEISPQFRLDKQLATAEDYAFIRTALLGLISATDDHRAKQAFEKIDCVSNPSENGIILDFSVLREGDTATLHSLQSAILEKRSVRFVYTNNNNETRPHCVEPIAVVYRWYAWYLLAYSKIKKDYRSYKLIRMRDLEITDLPFTKEHEPASTILKKNDSTDSRKYLNILIKCSQPAIPRIKEYLNGTILKEHKDSTVPNENKDRTVLMELTVVENEHLWLGTLLSLGDQIEIVAPEWLRSHLMETAKKIISLYQ